jgi:hypothetical protein
MADTSNYMIPSKVHDVLLHTRESDKDKTIFPFTRYACVLNKPDLVSDVFEAPGAPFVLYTNESVEMTEDELREMCGNII